MRIAVFCIGILSALPGLSQDQPRPTPQTNSIAVVGLVANPGVYSVPNDADRPLTVIDALARAGGLFPDADHRAFILRTSKDGIKHLIEVPLLEIINRKQPDVTLQDGDILQIPKTPI